MSNQPNWICADCGSKYGNRPVEIATWHINTCDICKQKRIVTEPRDYGGVTMTKEYGQDPREDKRAHIQLKIEKMEEKIDKWLRQLKEIGGEK